MDYLFVTKSGEVILATHINYEIIKSSINEEYLELNTEQANKLINNIRSLETSDYTKDGKYTNRFMSSAERTELMERIAEEFGLTTPFDMLKHSRASKYVIPRHIYHTILTIKSKMSLSTIAKLTGFNHATVIHSRKKVFEYLEYDYELRPKIQRLFNYYNISYETEQKKHS